MCVCVPAESVCCALAAKPADGKTEKRKIFESRAAAFRFLRKTERPQSELITEIKNIISLVQVPPVSKSLVPPAANVSLWRRSGSLSLKLTH